VNGWNKKFYANGSQKKTEVAKLKSGKIDHNQKQ
jgi:hypothetical protein